MLYITNTIKRLLYTPDKMDKCSTSLITTIKLIKVDHTDNTDKGYCTSLTALIMDVVHPW